MSRVQLALNVDDLDEAVAFYSKLFDAEPAKRQARLRQLRRRRAAAEAGADREPRPGRHYQPPRGRGRVQRAVHAEIARLTGRGDVHRRADRHHLLLRHPGQGLGDRAGRARSGRSTPCWPTRRPSAPAPKTSPLIPPAGAPASVRQRDGGVRRQGGSWLLALAEAPRRWIAGFCCCDPWLAGTRNSSVLGAPSYSRGAGHERGIAEITNGVLRMCGDPQPSPRVNRWSRHRNARLRFVHAANSRPFVMVTRWFTEICLCPDSMSVRYRRMSKSSKDRRTCRVVTSLPWYGAAERRRGRRIGRHAQGPVRSGAAAAS